MKTCFTYALALLLAVSLIKVNAQTNSVLLKDGTGALISSHNSIGAAYGAIPATLTQPYIVEIDVTYTGSSETYPITFVTKTGASAANTITLRPALGVASVTIQTTIATANSGVFVLNDADYVVIDGRPGGTGNTNALVFSNLSTASNGNTVVFINGACYNVMRNCTVLNATTSGTGRAIFLAASASNTTGNSNNLFKYCVLNGGRYQFNSNGTAANSNTENIIFGCSFLNSTFAAFWGQVGTAKVTFDSCSFSCTTPTGSGLYFGICFDSQKDSAIIKNNRFYDIQDLSTGALRYIHVRSIAASSVNFTDIRNNFFSMMTGNAALIDVAMIEHTGTDAHARIIHNSFRVGGTQTGAGTSGNVVSSALILSSTSALSGYEVKNNLFVNERTGGTSGVQHVAMSIENASPSFTIQDNTYNSTTGNLVRWTTAAYNTIAGYQGVVPGGEPNANNVQVQYVSSNDLHLSSPANTNLLAPQIAGINTDIDWELRPSSTFRGADEAITGTVITVNSGTICAGSPFTITPSGAGSYTYSGGSAFVNPTVSTDYTVTGSNGGVAISSVTVYSLPLVSVNSGLICTGDSFTMVPFGAANYTYSSGSDIVTPASSNDYTITGEDGNGCINTAVSSVTVKPLPNVSVNSGTVCSGSSFTINATGADNYFYSTGSNIVNPTANESYTVTGTDIDGCQNTAISSVSIITLPAVSIVASKTIACINTPAIILLGSPVSGTYSGTNVSSSSFNPVSIGTFTPAYTYTSPSTGCSKTATTSIIVSECTGINEVTNTSEWFVYPNPAENKINIESNNNSEKNILLTELTGKIIYQIKTSSNFEIIDLTNYASGVYILRIQSDMHSKIIKVIKQ